MNPDDSLLSLAIIMASLLLTLFFTQRVKTLLIHNALLDIPNERSSHKTPVPRGGGWALLMVLVPALVLTIFFVDADLRHVGLIAALVLLAGISWLDDKRHVNPIARLSVHIFVACLGSFSFTPQEMLFGGMAPFWLDRTLMILGWAWFINLYNFMDGIDGITGVETISIATGLCILLSAAAVPDPFTAYLTLVLTGVCLGFLAYNWHPAGIFLGDVGSVPLGFLTGFCLLSLAVKGHLAAALILPLYYLADSGITITRRAIRGEKIWQAHRQHFYQRAALAVDRHDRVVLWIATANTGLIAAAIVALDRPLTGLMAGAVVTAILLAVMNKKRKKSAR